MGEGKRDVKRPNGWDHHAGRSRPSGKRRSALAATFVLTLLAGLMGSAGTGQAALIHEFDSYFGGGSLATPEALAVDQTTGDLYVLERGDGCVSRFYGERGGPEALEPHDFSATGTNQLCGLQFRESPSAAQVAIDNSGTSTEGEIYVNSPLRNEVGATLGYDPEGNLDTELPPHGEEYICGVATDSAGGVHVAQHYSGIWDYSHNDPVTDADFLGGAYEGPICGIARASSGLKYNVFEPNGPVIKVPPSTVLRDATYALTLDPSSDDVYLSEGGLVTAISDDGILFDQFGSGDVTEARGVAVDEVSGTAYVSDTPNGRIAMFGGERAYRVEVEPTGTGLGAVSAATPPVKDCGDNGQCAGYYLPSTVVLKATPQLHSEVDGWTGCDDVSPAGDECSVEVTAANRKVFANFTRLKQTVTAATLGTGSGSVSDANGLGAIQGCGDAGTCSGPYDEGSAIELVATPTGHSTFTGWSGDCTNQSGPCNVVVEGSPSVTAHFTAQHAVSVKKAGSGAGGVVSAPGGLDCGAVCVGFFTDGQTVTLSAVPSGHSTFVGWSGAGCSGTDVCEVEAGEATTTVTANFAHDGADVVTDPTVTFIGQHVATVHGSVDPNGAAVTRCVVEYGTGPGYGAEQPCAPTSVGNGDAPVAVGVDLRGLRPGTTYHFRFTATNSGGSAYGADQTLRTLDDTCDTNDALCPVRVIPSESSTKKCRKGQVRKKGRCVKRKHHRGHARKRHGTGARR